MERPLSPHLQVYRLPLSAIMSISHRFTGIVLSTFILWIPFWLYGLLVDNYWWMDLSSFITYPASLIYLFSFFYHLCNGLRYLVWSFAFGMDLQCSKKTGWFVIISSILLTVIVGVVL